MTVDFNSINPPSSPSSSSTPIDTIADQLSLLSSSQNLNADPRNIQIRASSLFARLKALNRTANASVRTRKLTTAEARLEVDQTHLLLQNLLYEKRHLEREIEKCRQFGSIYQDVPLHATEEFEQLAPEGARTAEVMNDAHQLMLNRLSFELAERQRLEQRRKELVAQKEEMSKQSKLKLTTIDNVKSEIDVLVKTASEIQRKVDEMIASIPLPPD